MEDSLETVLQVIADFFTKNDGARAWCALAGLVVGLIAGRWLRWRPRRRAGGGGGGGGGDCVEIYVGNLSYDMNDAQLRKEFERFGAVKSARVIENRFNHKSKGFGFVEMPNRPEAEAAIKSLHDRDLMGRKMRVNEAKNKSRE
jgi:hypothetical protein